MDGVAAGRPRRIALVTRGANRLVLLTPGLAWKVPNVRRWFQACWGMIDNMQERRANGLGPWGRRQDGICPLVFSLPGGLLNVMRRARPLTDAEWAGFDPAGHCRRQFPDGTVYWISAEPKRDSFGVLDGRIVALDYGN